VKSIPQKTHLGILTIFVVNNGIVLVGGCNRCLASTVKDTAFSDASTVQFYTKFKPRVIFDLVRVIGSSQRTGNRMDGKLSIQNQYRFKNNCYS
jgi:hypothetical protein